MSILLPGWIVCVQTACLALSGPLPVPETDGGRAWYTAFDEDWEPIQVCSILNRLRTHMFANYEFRFVQVVLCASIDNNSILRRHTKK